jgi:tryptophan-rich sensory protein
MIASAPKTNATRTALVTVPLIVGIGLLTGKLSGSGYGNDWFDALLKPSLMPPGWLFGAAWTILYTLLGSALAIVWAAPSSSARLTGLTLFLFQLVLNFSWSPLFFGLHEVGLALIGLVAILILSTAAAIQFRRVRPIAAWLMTPYLAWLGFATYLNFEILRLNAG